MREPIQAGLLLRAKASTARYSDPSLTGLTIAPDGTITVVAAGSGLGVRLDGPQLVSLALLLGETGMKLMQDSDDAAQAATDALNGIFGPVAGHA